MSRELALEWLKSAKAKEDARRFYQFALEVYRKARTIVQASTTDGMNS